MDNERKAVWARILGFLFFIALLMGPGPGMYFANRPTSVFGIPMLYAWGLLWYAVELSIIVAAYFLVWSDSDADPAGKEV